MLELNTRTLFRAVSLFIMITLMVSFAGKMADGYMDSIQCISSAISFCKTNNTQPDPQMVSSEPGNDEWLCAMGELNYCNFDNGMTVALQTK